jgi:glutamine cyclotransferase
MYFWDPETLKEIRRISIQDENGLRNNINELEFINGAVYANVWQSNEILKIDPSTGNVIGKLDLTSVKQSYPELSGGSNSDKVLNGIAWDSSGQRLFITGKNWSKLFELKLLN